MLVVPIYAGGFERNDGRTLQRWSQYSSRRDLIFEWIREMGKDPRLPGRAGRCRQRSHRLHGAQPGRLPGSDLLIARAPTRRAPALERRLSVLQPARDSAESIAHGLHRTTVPVLMLNGRYDFAYPARRHQKPFFDLLATPDENKRHVLFETGHWPFPMGELVRENLAWLDRHLGPVAAPEGQARSR